MPIDADDLTKLTEDQQYDAKLAALRAAIDEGYASGIGRGRRLCARPRSAQTSNDTALARAV